HASQEVVPPTRINPDIPRELEEIVLRCLEKDPEHRFQDVVSLRAAPHDVRLDDPWSADLAAEWRSCNDCPERKREAAELVEAICAADRWSAERAQKWYDDQPWLVGCNFIPSTAINQLEMWQPDTFDPKTIDRELGWAQSLGFNTVRVFLHNLPWHDDRDAF